MMFEEAAFSSSEIQQLLADFHSELPALPTSSSDDISHSSPDDEKKRKRRILNRESARRSRWRKKMHLEKLNEQAKLLSVENRELKKQLHMVTYQYHLVLTESDRLLAESIILEQRLAILSQFLPPACPSTPPMISGHFHAL